MNLHDIIAENKPQLIGALVGALSTATLLALFVGRKQFTWLVKELIKMYSANAKSYFSKKRIESGIAFIIAEHGAIFWLAKKYADMNTTDFGIWITIQLAIAGWYVSQIQGEKKLNPGTGSDVDSGAGAGAGNTNGDGK